MGCEIAILSVNPCIKETRAVLEHGMDSSRKPLYTDSECCPKCFSPQCLSRLQQTESAHDTTPMTHPSWNITRHTSSGENRQTLGLGSSHDLRKLSSCLPRDPQIHGTSPWEWLWEQPQALQEGRRFREGCDPSYFKHKFSPFKQRSHFSLRQWRLDLVCA